MFAPRVKLTLLPIHTFHELCIVHLEHALGQLAFSRFLSTLAGG